MKQWYSHLIEIESIIFELDQMKLSNDEKLHLAKLADSSLHNAILDMVLSQLSEFDKRKFIDHVTENDHDKLWKFLNERVDDVEMKITKVANQLKDELKKDLKEAKRYA